MGSIISARIWRSINENIYANIQSMTTYHAYALLFFCVLSTAILLWFIH
ncbi:hypothetical protein J608_4250, partial [Acinetobacter baumannii 1288284]